MSDSNVIREFLVSLGFKVDEVGMKKFTTSVEHVSKQVLKLGAEVAAAATGIVVGVKIISSQMENLYYASQRTGATVGNIMALRYAASQIGLTADQAQGALENFARTLRLNPGTSSLLDSLGVTGKDPAEKFDNFIAKAKTMQPYVAAAYAQLFGIDPDTLLMLEQGQDKRLEAEKQYHGRLRAFGINPDQAAKTGVDFNNLVRRATSNFQLLWVVIESKLLPVLNPLIEKFERWSETHADSVARGIAAAVQVLSDVIGSIDWGGAMQAIESFWDSAKSAFNTGLGWLEGFWAHLVEMFRNNTGYIRTILEFLFILPEALIHHWGMVRGFFSWMWGGIKDDFSSAWAYISPIVDKLKGAVQWIENSWLGRKLSSLLSSAKGVADTVSDVLDNEWGYDPSAHNGVPGPTGALFSSLEGKFGLPPRTLDKVWDIESGRGAHMLSPAGAKGHFQFMDATARQYGVKDPNDLSQSAAGAAAYLHDLLQRYAGDIHKALAAYNWGEGNLDKDIALHGNAWGSFLPAETANYLRKFDGTRLGASSSSPAGVNIQQQYTFHIDGARDPQATARAVSGEQSRVNGDLVRNFAGAFR